MTTLYGMADSGNCYKPRLLMAKLGIPFTNVEVSSHTGDTRKPDYVAKNPNAMVPLLELAPAIHIPGRGPARDYAAGVAGQGIAPVT